MFKWEKLIIILREKNSQKRISCCIENAWKYEYVTIALPDGQVLDLTRDLKDAENQNVIDVSFMSKKK